MHSQPAPPMMDAVGATQCGNAHRARDKGFVMAARSIRSVVARFVVVTGLAASLLAGSSALVHPSQASAARLTCEQASLMANYYRNMGDTYSVMFEVTGNTGYAVTAAHYYGLADAYYDYC
jgi:hypothetical protein